MRPKSLLLSVVLLAACYQVPLSAEEALPSYAGSLKWKCAAWWGPEGSVKAAKEMGFNAIIAGFFGERLTKTVQEGKKHDVEIYLDIEFLGGGEFTQVMGEEEEKRVASKTAATAPDVATWEPGKRGDPFGLKLWCFARPEALEYGKAKIEKYLPKFDGHGICLDAIGFRNQYRCLCKRCNEFFRLKLSEALVAGKYPVLVKEAVAERSAKRTPKRTLRRRHHASDMEAVSDKFAEKILCRFITELAEHARKIRPKIKVAVHVEPTFAPNPSFARKLPVDYWLTSVSYYSKPHWSLETVGKLSRDIAGAQGTAMGIPYIGFISGKNSKTPVRLNQEVRSVVDSGASGIALFELSEIVKDPAMALAVRRVLPAETKRWVPR